MKISKKSVAARRPALCGAMGCLAVVVTVCMLGSTGVWAQIIPAGTDGLETTGHTWVQIGGEMEACCWPDGSCTEELPEDCMMMGGWLPGYQFCEPGICDEPEACCLPDGWCVDGLQPNDCFAQGGWPQGPGSMCVGILEACCFDDGTCLDVDPLCCDDLGGWPGYAAMCLGDLNSNGIDDACEIQEIEACCFEDGTCQDLIPSDCFAQGGTPVGPGSMCTGVLQACCFDTGVCLDADPLCCELMGGWDQGPGTACVDMTIACCFPDGSCWDVDPICCDDLGGVPGYAAMCLGDLNGNGIDDACEEPQEPEACCFEDGTCQDLLPDDCVAQDGTPVGPGTMCTGMLQACCFDTGVCLDADPICCELMGGWDQGPGTACVDMTIACCFPDGSCMDVDPICCDDLGGIPGFAAMCLGDLNGNGIDDACEIITDYKWEQPPDLDISGMDVNASWLFGESPYVLADDFNCTRPGPLTEIHVWGSWYLDYMPLGDPMNVTFTLSIHEDIPIGPDGYSIPGELLWMRMFNPGEFVLGQWYEGLQEGWLNPPDYYEWPGDTICFEYIFFLEPSEFFQQGTPEYPVVYWLDVHADPHEMAAMFGWKTTPLEFQWNDNAVWGQGLEPYPGPWYELYYPPMHQMWPDAPLDLAFTIHGIEYPICPGDANCDGEISWRDIDFFVAAMNDNYAAWAAMFLPGVPTCPFANNDVNGDGTVNWRDIDPFVALMNTTCP